MRAPRLLIAALLLAVGVTALVAPPPASAVERTLKTVYKCEANGNSGRAKARIRVDLPRHVHKGDRLSARPIRVRLVMPDALTDYLRGWGVTSIKGSSPDAYYRIRARQFPIKNLHVPETAVPDSGPLVLHARGRAVGHTFKRLGRYPIYAGRGFTTNGTVYGGIAGSGTSFTMGCNMPTSSTPDKIAVVRVVP